MLDPLHRFSNRVENYLKYRPRYPPEILRLLESKCNLTSETVIADLGSGTGFLTELFLQNGNKVFGVEPNSEMRAAGERVLAHYTNFISIDGKAEATTLPQQSIDLISAGQAFHWFDREKARMEFERILKPGGWVVLVWNGFHAETSPLIKGYQEVMVEYGTDYQEVNREIEGLDLANFFLPHQCQLKRFPYRQIFDFEGLKGRFLSASYAPEPSNPRFDEMVRDLRAVFQTNQRDGTVSFDYETEVYYGQLD